MIGLILSVLLAVAPAAAEPVKLIAFGDSLTAGYGLAEGDGLVPQLRAWMAARGEVVEFVQAGVSGDTTAGGRARLDWALEAGVQGVVLELGGNDVLRGLPPEEARANLAAMIETAQAKGLEVLLVGVPVAANYGPDYQAAFRAIWPDLAAEHDTLIYPDLLAALGADPAQAVRYMQGDGLHPNAEGVRLIVEDFGPSVAALADRIRAGAGG
ncbi:MAG: arylesterase [Paracoccaceae bacterium]